MTFLNPAVLMGLAAASIPVLIHLLNLRKLKKIEFSTLNFLKQLQKNKIRRVRLKQWLLLALRVLIILMLVTAFARPTLEGVSIGGTTSAAKTTAIFVLDDTFSMSVIDQKGSYFNQAIETIKRLLNQLEKGDDVGLILVSGDKDYELPLTSNINSLEKRLDELKISSASGTISSALIAASGLISQSKNFNKEIYLLTDFQKGRIAIDENISNLNQVLKEQVKLYSFGFAEEVVYNIGIDALLVTTKIFEKGKPVRFEATVTNYSGQTVNNLVVSLFLGGKRSAQQSINLNPGETTVVQLEGITKQTGYVDAYVEIEDDDISMDNTRYASVYIPEVISVIILHENIADTKFIKLALQPAVENGNIKLTEQKLSRINSVQLNSYDVVILVGGNENFNTDELLAYLRNGGGVALFPSSQPELSGFQNLAGKILLPSPSGIVISSDENSDPVDFDKTDFNHPVFQNIFRDDKKMQIASPEIKTYYKISPRGKGNSLITLLDGSSFLGEYKIGNGKVFVFNVAPVLEWSDFPLKSIFAPLIYKSIYYLAAKRNTDIGYLSGEPLNINISNRLLPQIKIEKPDRSEDLINLNGNDSEFISYNNTFVSGNYDIYSGEKLLEMISVNNDPIESNVTYISDSEFDDYLTKVNYEGVHFRIAKGEDPAAVILQARFGSELWRYFLIAAFILALLEMTIARSAKKELAEVSE
ncbi:MAG: BatA and WFA domain-containing protein [Ignavibacterium sp.]|nr:MAG: BatA and WFA domain-containing protein [Ignavibacterium sp.]